MGGRGCSPPLGSTTANAPKYPAGVNDARQSGSSYFEPQNDALPQVAHPWRRYFARMTDIALCNLLWSLVVGFAFCSNLSARGGWAAILDAAATLALLLFLGLLSLRLTGTTPGKAIFGLRLDRPGGERLSYAEALDRTWLVIGKGLGYGIPIYNIVRL